MKLVGSTKNKINNDKNGEKALHLEITEVVLSKPASGTQSRVAKLTSDSGWLRSG